MVPIAFIPMVWWYSPTVLDIGEKREDGLYVCAVIKWILLKCVSRRVVLSQGLLVLHARFLYSCFSTELHFMVAYVDSLFFPPSDGTSSFQQVEKNLLAGLRQVAAHGPTANGPSRL